MRILLVLPILFLISACSPPTKQEALDYYELIRFEKCSDVLTRLDAQYNEVKTYTSDPGKLIDGPSTEEHAKMHAAEQKNLKDLRACLVELEEIDLLGDEAEYLEAMKLYLYTRVRFEEEVMLKFIKRLKGGMTPEESTFLSLFTGRIMELFEQQDKLVAAEEEFIEEFKITDEELASMYLRYY